MKGPKKGRSASKRTTLKWKYKVERKVAEKHRKQRKFEKVAAKHTRQKKDPGIPNLHPFKHEMMRKAEEQRQRSEEQHELRRKENLRLKAKEAKSSATSLAQMQADAARRGSDFDEMNEGDDAAAVLDNIPETSRKAYYKEFKKVVEAADVILEVLDARDPLGCRCQRVERQVLAAGAGKRLVLVLNKIDLVPQDVVQQWLKYLRNEFPTIAFKSSTQTQASNLKQHTGEPVGGKASGAAACYGAPNMLSLLGNYCRSLDIKTSIRVGVIGYPNVGKSSLINSLKRSRVCGVGNTPGFTKTCQEISLDKHVKLIDSPGIVFADGHSTGDLILRNCVKLENLIDPITPVNALLSRCDHTKIMEKYLVPAFSSTLEFLQHLARRLGRLKKRGVPDTEAVARIVLQDWNCGKISYFTTPPVTHTMPAHLSANVVTSWSKEFDVAALENDADMPSLMRQEDCDGIAMSSTPLQNIATDVEMGSGATKEESSAAYDFATDFE